MGRVHLQQLRVAGCSVAADGARLCSRESVGNMPSVLQEGLVVPVRKEVRTLLLQAMYSPQQCALYCPVQHSTIPWSSMSYHSSKMTHQHSNNARLTYAINGVSSGSLTYRP